MSYEYRVFIVHRANEATFLHLSAEPLRDERIIEVERPGSDLDGHSVIVYPALTHPLDGRPGIAYARESPRLVAARRSLCGAAAVVWPGWPLEVPHRSAVPKSRS